jgi:hypothetical protein
MAQTMVGYQIKTMLSTVIIFSFLYIISLVDYLIKCFRFKFSMLQNSNKIRKKLRSQLVKKKNDKLLNKSQCRTA